MALTPLQLSTLVARLGLPEGTQISISGDSSMAALSDTSLATFRSTDADTFLILSSGIAEDVSLPNTTEFQGTDIGAEGVSGDTIQISFTLPTPEDSNRFSFSFSFLSEEFPEFVGSEFNDFFSATVNGNEIALDTDDNPITVNNNFFSGALTAIGTFFDGQTPPLTTSIGVTPGENLTISLTVADVGDGFYDSAAFIGNFNFSQSQVVYLDFDGGTVDWPRPWWYLDNPDFHLPDSGIGTTDQAAIIATVDAIYSDFNIEFTNTRPTSGEYSTIHIGGAVSNLPSYLEPPNGLLGRAEQIDDENKDQSDNAFVLSAEIGSQGLLEQVIAHEVGHILGLRHVDESIALMYPFASSTSTTISDGALLAEIDRDTKVVTPTGGEQNSFDELARSLGLSGSQLLVEEASFFDQFLTFFGFSVTESTAVYDVRAVTFVQGDDSEGKILTNIVELGDLSGNSSLKVTLPVLDGDQIVVIGKTTPDGSYDVILNDGSLSNFAPLSSLSEEEVLTALGVVALDLNEMSTSFSAIQDDGSLNTLGVVDIDVFNVGDNTATGAVVITGTPDPDTLVGGKGNDIIKGLGSNDSLTGNEANDLINGGAGIDTAIYSGNQASYTLTLSPTSTTLTDRRADGNGTDQLINMEFLDFDTEIPALGGSPLNLAMFGGPTELSDDKFSDLIELYIAYFDRAPDALGLNFWATNYSKGQPLEEIANLFLDQDETRALYPEGTSNGIFLENVYGNVLGRLPDQGGFDFWLGHLDSGALGRDKFIFNFLGGAQGSDVGFLENKVMIGTYFAVTKGMSNGANSTAVMDLFDGTEASINTAIAAIDGYYADALDPTNGEFLMPLVGVLDDPFAIA